MKKPPTRGRKPTKGGKVGRPPTEITEEQWAVIEKMAQDMCTQQEIADYLGIGVRTLHSAHLKDRFDKVTRMAYASTRWNVRRKQLASAMKGQPVGQIWWGKQHLAQKDRPDAQDEGQRRELDIVIGAEQRLLEMLERLAKNKAIADSGVSP